MKAVKIYGPSTIKIEEVPVKQPGEGEVLIKIKAVGLCGTDYELYTNDMVYLKNGLSKLPLIPGHEWSGVVEKTGQNVKKFSVGDKVSGECTVSCGKCCFCQKGSYNQCIDRTETGIMNRDGGFAEYITFPETHLHKFESISFEEAALIEPTGIALFSVMKANVTPLDNVLVIGPGPIGLMVAQIVKKVYGSKNVILVGTRDERLKMSKDFDLDGTINIRKEQVEEKVRAITGGQMIDVVIETSGGADVFKDIEKVIQPCGRIVLVGFFAGKKAEINWDAFIVKDIEIIGTLGSPGIWDNVIELLESRKITTRPLISHEMRLDEFEKGIDIMANRKENVCKVIFKP